MTTTNMMGIAHATTALDLYTHCTSQRSLLEDLLCITYIDGAVAGLSLGIIPLTHVRA